MVRTIAFSESLAFSRIDREAGVIYGVSVITEGPARGHPLMVDNTTLAQLLEASKAFSNGVKVKQEHSGGVGEILGAVKNLRIEGQKLLGDFHLLDTCASRAHVLELADKLPDTFGLSVSFQGEHDGTLARCSRIHSIDLVADPAANPDGLFSESVDRRSMDMPDAQTQNGTAAQDNSSLAALEQRVAALEELVRAAVEAEKNEQEKLSQDPSQSQGQGDGQQGQQGQSDSGKKDPEKDADLSEIRKSLTQLSSQNAALAELLKNVGGKPLPASAAAAKQAAITFSQKVEEFVKEGKSRGEATLLAVKKFPELHRADLAAKGIIAL
jgi:hypothetical protein